MKGYLFFVAVLLCAPRLSFSQDSLAKDQLLLKAMSHEIVRNMENLKEDDYEKPFFIAYTLSDIHYGFSLATLGALVNSAGAQNRSWNARVIVGGYDINDENFDNSFQSASYDPGYPPMPIDSDYWGVRRVFWIATNNIYKSAARNFSQKKKNLSENRLEYPLGDFSKVEPVKYYDTTAIHKPNLAELEEISRKISEKFKGHHGLVNSGAYVSNISAVNYLVNSEGTEVRMPFSISSIYVTAAVLGKSRASKNGNLQYLAFHPDELPSVEMIHEDIGKLIEDITDTTEIDELEDDYMGPVLLEGQAVAEFFVANLLHSGDDGLLARRSDMPNVNKKTMEKFVKELQEELEKKEENKVAVSTISVKAMPFLEEFEGTKLLGHFAVDAEGVAPEEMVLVENGILKTKLNGRTPAIGAKGSNGYMRFQVSNAAVSKSLAPGVLMITSEKTMSKDSLLAEFFREAGEEELNFAIKIRSTDVHASSKPFDYLKIDLDSVTEKKVMLPYTNYKKKNTLKKIIAVSDEYYVHNFLYKGGGGGWLGGGMFGDGVPVSIIVPSAIVVKDFEISSYKGDTDPFEPTIKGPFEQ